MGAGETVVARIVVADAVAVGGFPLLVGKGSFFLLFFGFISIVAPARRADELVVAGDVELPITDVVTAFESFFFFFVFEVLLFFDDLLDCASWLVEPMLLAIVLEKLAASLAALASLEGFRDRL